MKTLITVNDLFHNTINITEGDIISKDELDFINGYKSGKIKVYMCFEKNTDYTDFLLSICRGYAIVNSINIYILDMGICCIAFVVNENAPTSDHLFIKYVEQCFLGATFFVIQNTNNDFPTSGKR